MYSRMEEADALIDDLSRDKDPNLRICGMYTIAMAYCGTGNNKAIKQLLHVAVSRCLTEIGAQTVCEVCNASLHVFNLEHCIKYFRSVMLMMTCEEPLSFV